MHGLPLEDRVALLEDQVRLLMRALSLASETHRIDPRKTRQSHANYDLVGFTMKQHATLQMLSLGWSNLKIAHALAVSESTAKVHVRALMKKLMVDNRVAIAQCFREMTSHWTPDDYKQVTGIEIDWAIHPETYPHTTSKLQETK